MTGALALVVGLFFAASIGAFFATNVNDFRQFGSCLDGARGDQAREACADRAELERWTQRLDELGVEHSDIKDRPYGSGVSFRDPDGIALEFFAPPS